MNAWRAICFMSRLCRGYKSALRRWCLPLGSLPLGVPARLWKRKPPACFSMPAKHFARHRSLAEKGVGMSEPSGPMPVRSRGAYGGGKTRPFERLGCGAIPLNSMVFGGTRGGGPMHYYVIH